MAGRFGPAKRGRVLTLGLARRPQRPELAERLGQGPFGLRNRDLEVDLARRQRLSQRPTLDRQVRFGRRALVGQPHPVAIDRLEIAGELRGPQLEVRQQGPRRVMRLAPFPLGLRPLRELRSDSRGGFLRRLQRGHRPIGFGPLAIAPNPRLGRPAGCLVPARVRREDECVGKLLAGGQPSRLLLGLGREAAGLGSELGENVLDPG